MLSISVDKDVGAKIQGHKQTRVSADKWTCSPRARTRMFKDKSETDPSLDFPDSGDPVVLFPTLVTVRVEKAEE